MTEEIWTQGLLSVCHCSEIHICCKEKQLHTRLQWDPASKGTLGTLSSPLWGQQGWQLELQTHKEHNTCHAATLLAGPQTKRACALQRQVLLVVILFLLCLENQL